MLAKLREYFSLRSDAAFSFLFGSYARGTQREECDIDLAVVIERNGKEQTDKKISP